MSIDLTTPVRPSRLWTPRRVLVTAAAAALPHGQAMVERVGAAGVEDVTLLSGNRLPSLSAKTAGGDRAAYSLAKDTLAVVAAPPSAARLAAIPPSADWRVDLATGCPAHCQYCYLAGSLTGPPITRAYANLGDITAALDAHVGSGAVTSRSAERRDEGTTFEASCYTDPLGIEHLTGSLAALITHVGTTEFGGPVQLRFTTKYDAVDGLLDLPHSGRTRIRFSVNALDVTRRFEGGTAPLPARLAAMRRVALAGYPVGLTIAPVMPVSGWEAAYDELLRACAAALAGVPELDLTAEVITHRFTASSKATQLEWYPRTKLDLDEERRSVKRTKFGGQKFVYPREQTAALRAGVLGSLERHLPQARLLYWT
jgi:spore photoproduct lyase